MSALPAQPQFAEPIGATATKPAQVVNAYFANGQAWWDSIGRVPLERVMFNPPPGLATVDDVVRLDDHEDCRCELISGTLVRKAVGFEESQIAINIAVLVSSFVKSRRLGATAGEGGMLTLPSSNVRIPDFCFIAAGKLPPGKRSAAPSIVPDLVVEVISPSNTIPEMTLKLGEYFTAGVRLVWYVYPLTKTIDAYTSPTQFQSLTVADRVAGGDVLPGFDVAVADIFDI